MQGFPNPYEQSFPLLEGKDIPSTGNYGSCQWPGGRGAAVFQVSGVTGDTTLGLGLQVSPFTGTNIEVLPAVAAGDNIKMVNFEMPPGAVVVAADIDAPLTNVFVTIYRY